MRYAGSIVQDSMMELSAAIVASANHLMIATDLTGIVTFFNSASERALGYSADEVIKKHSPALWHEGAEVLQRAAWLTAELGRTIEPGFDVFVELAGLDVGEPLEWTFRRKDGSTFPAYLTVTRIHAADKTVTGYLGVIEDCTERKRLVEDLKQTNGELEEFTYRTSHDLRSPLVSSIQLLKVAREAITDSESGLALHSLGLAQTSLEKLEDLVKDILSLAQSRLAPEEHIEVCINDLVAESLAKFKNLHGFDRVSVQLDLKFPTKILTKRTRAALIVENMISNAIKYQDQNEEAPYIAIATYQQGPNLVLRVEDNGLGVPAEQQANLFQMFKRFHSRVAFGSGLGLYMMKKSAEVLGGKVSFEDPGKGAVFKAEIPVAPAPGQAQA